MRNVGRDTLAEWYIVFTEGNPGWISRLLKPGFRHVWAFSYDPASRTWIIFEPGWDGTLIRALPRSKGPGLVATAANQGTVVRMKAQRNKVKRARVVMACTSQIANLVGVDILVHTPWRLFCALLKQGATVEFRDLQEETPHG